METRNRAIIEVSSKMLLDWLQFQGGEVYDMYINHQRRTVALLIEHPDLPEVSVGELYMTIIPEYTLLGGQVERTQPPKKKRNKYGKLIRY